MSVSLDPHLQVDHAVIRTFKVASGQTLKAGFTVRFAGADDEIQDAGADSHLAIGVAKSWNVATNKTWTAGEWVQVVMLGSGGAIVPMKVGTNGVTRGAEVHQVASGIEDAPAPSAAGATSTPIIGQALQAGVANDLVGVLVYRGIRITA